MTTSDNQPSVGEIEAEPLFVGYKTWPADADDWSPAYTAVLDPNASHPIHRSAWQDPDDPRRVVLVDVTERDSRESAIGAMEERVGWDATSRLLNGPDGLGDLSRTQSLDASPATYFVRGNLAMVIMNQGPEPVDTTRLARRIDNRLIEKLTAGRIIPLSAEPPDPQVGAEVTLQFLSPWASSDEHYYKFFVDGAGVRKNEEGDVVITRDDPGLAQVYLYGVEREGAGLAGSVSVEFLEPPG